MKKYLKKSIKKAIKKAKKEENSNVFDTMFGNPLEGIKKLTIKK